ncbi:spore germination protein [Sporosarcina cyprini]|uniref:spore germination protein n=1 Tax=Sporosarcina cyprini TaxID=2910523 RepID=UPI001EE13087|nr:spore germination protein [Sporosarcina cyprini]MCG3086404.1 spore germination protein [Sporosarcina cyprini]
MGSSSEKQQPPELLLQLAQQLSPTKDIVQTTLHVDGMAAHLLYLKSAVDSIVLQKTIIQPFFQVTSLDDYASYLNSDPNQTEMADEQTVLVDLTKGNVLVAVEHRFFLLEVRKVGFNEVQQITLEPTIHGAQLGLSESLETSLNVIRQRYHKPSLIFDTMQLKDQSNRSIALVYDKITVNPRALQLIKKRLDNLDFPLILSSGDLQLYLNGTKKSLFPACLLTERPDRLVYNISAGKIIIIVDGSPHAVIAPVVFFDFMVSMEDLYHGYWISILTIILRYAGLLACVILPALYVGITSYTPDVFRTELALTVAASRIGVPYPSFMEVFFMLLFIEFLTEASIRLPSPISATATTVGGLILGTAAVEAALTSNIMIIVVSLVAVSTFVIPINELGFAVRGLRFILLIYTTFFGLAGLAIGLLGIVLFLANKESFGESYLKFGWRKRKKEFRTGEG